MLFSSDVMASTATNVTFGNAYSSVQANSINGSVHIGPNILDRLPYAEDAPFNSYAKQHEPTCLPDTRVDLLQEIYSWADGQDKRRIFWLSGLAGTGKSTIARTIARRYHDKQCLAASFFFSRGGGDIGHAGKFVTSLAVQFARNVPPLKQRISDAVAERDDIASQSLHDQWQHLVLRPLSKLQETEAGQRIYIIVVDALDECDNDSNIRIIVQLLAEARSLTKVRLRVLLTSRPEVPIRHGFRQVPETEHQDVVLHYISRSIVDHDIALFLEYNLQLIAQERCLRAGWPGAEIVVQLVRSAGGLFIWAATACRFIQAGKQFAAKRLETILCNRDTTSVAPERHLNEIYTTVLQNSIQDYTDEEKEEQCRALRYIIGSIAVMFSPLSVQSLDQLLDITEGVQPTLEDLHAILDIPTNRSWPVRLHHPSFRDFLLDRKRCGDDRFYVDEKSTHEKLAHCCLELMSAAPSGLRQDMCNLSDPGTFRRDIDEEKINRNLLPELQYACRYWVDHLERSGRSVEDGDATHCFLEKHLLHWLEAMSLLNEASLCVRLLARLQALATPSDSPVAKFLHDAVRFVLRFVPILGKAPLQIYSSALLFSPESSVVQKTFIKQVPQTVRVISGRDAEWDACRSVLEGHSDAVWAVVFSPDGQLVASASHDKTVRIWETATGQCRSVLEGHLRGVIAVVFSQDGQLVASVSWDRTVRVWETATGQCRNVLESNLEEIDVAVFSPDGQLVAFASADSTVQVWETATGYCCSVLEGHSASVSAVVFSPDGQLVATASDDSTVRVWETVTGQCRSVLEGHSRGVIAVVFSPDGQLVASASDDSTVRIWETATGQCCSVLEGHLEELSAVVFSLNGQLVASASDDSTVRIWETATGQCRSVLKGHLSRIRAVVFSPDGHLVASASRDRTVRVWETATGHCRSVLEGHSENINAVVFSLDGQLIASASYDKTVRVWETATGQFRSAPEGQCHTVLEDHLSWVRVVTFSPDGRLVASASSKTVRVWETATGQCRIAVGGHLSWVRTVVFSPDGRLVASASNSTVRVWETATGHCRSLREDQPWPISRMAFSPDGRTLYTNNRAFSLPLDPVATTTAIPAQELPYAAVDGEWVLLQKQPLLWLPPEYRHCVAAVHGHMMCLGCRSGRVTFLSFQ